MKQEQQTEQKIVIQPIKKRLLKVTLQSAKGSTLITHRLDPATVEAFTNREVGKTTKKKLRNYDEEYESCFYYTDNKKYGYPVGAFVCAILDACIPLDIPKTQIKRAVRVLGEIAPIKYKKINHRVDYPRRAGMNATPDVRHRPEFVDWSIELTVEFDENQISADQILNLFNQAGFSSEIGDWRPSAPKSSGTHGMFKVAKNKKEKKK